MATKSIYKRFDGSNWIEFYFKTSADLIDETTSYKVMTAAERTAIAAYLTTFNAANKLALLDGNGLIPSAKIPTDLSSYLKTNNPTFTGALSGSGLYGSIALQAIDGKIMVVHKNGSQVQDGWYSIDAITGGMQIELSTGGVRLKVESNLITVGTRITGVSAPTGDTDAATKKYVDDLVSTGLAYAVNGPVKAVSATNIGTLSGTPIIDGYQTVAGDRVLLINQTTASQNGIYTVDAGAWPKDTVDSTQGTLVFVENGSAYNDWSYQATSATAWAPASKVDSYSAGSGLTKTGTQFSIGASAITNAMLGGSIDWTKLASGTVNDNGNASYDTWIELGNANTTKTLAVALSEVHGAIGLLRGTASYNTNNTQTIAGVYTIANAKNATFSGTDDIPTGTFTAGDLYFKQLA